MPIQAKNIFFVKYGLLEHISMHERREKVKILIFLIEYIDRYSRQNHFRSFSHSV